MNIKKLSLVYALLLLFMVQTVSAIHLEDTGAKVLGIVGKSTIQWSSDAIRGLEKILSVKGETYYDNVLKGYGDDVAEITSKGVGKNAIDPQITNPELLAKHIRDNLGKKDPFGPTLPDSEYLSYFVQTKQGYTKVGAIQDVARGSKNFHNHFYKRHVTGEAISAPLTSFFPTGKQIIINGKLKQLPAAMTDEDLIKLLQETTSVTPTPSGTRLVFNKTGGTSIQGIDETIAVWDTQLEDFITFYPVKGNAVWAWDRDLGEFILQR